MKQIKGKNNPYRIKKFTKVVKDFEKQVLNQLEELQKETFAEIFEKVKIDNYKIYNDKYQKEGKIDSRRSIYRYFK